MSLMNSLPTTYGKNLTMAPTITLDNGEVYRTDQTIVQQKSLQPVTLSTLLYNEKTLCSPRQLNLRPGYHHIWTRRSHSLDWFHRPQNTNPYPGRRRTPDRHETLHPTREDARPDQRTSPSPQHTEPRGPAGTQEQITICASRGSTISSQAKDLDDHKYNAPALRSSISATFKSSKSSSTVHLFDPNTLFSLFSLWPHFWASGLSSLSCSLQRLQPQKKIIHCTHLDS
ncbi:hypothetical protein HRG_012897 [Hirsutella rhossiliensis]